VVLEGLGWRILRIWSTDWWTNAARECNRLHAALQAALDETREQTASPDLGESPPAPAEKEDEKPADEDDSEVATAHEDQSPRESARETPDGVRPDASRFYDDDYRETLRAIVLDEVAKWGPIRLDRLAQKAARLHGFQRTGREIQDRVSASIPRDCRRTKEGADVFVWPKGVDPSAWDAFRRPVGGEPRDPSEIPMEELVVLARKFTSIHHDQDAVLLAMRDACGLLKLREASRGRFLEALGRV
jgi:hypothetical protein